MMLRRHEAFARRIVAADESQAASYRAVYKTTGDSVYACASRLLRNAKVAQRIAELRGVAALRHNATIDSIGAELDRAHQLALENKQAHAAVAASMGKAKLYGLLIDRRETRTKGEFDDCKSTADIVDVLVKEAGSVRAVLEHLEAMKIELMKRPGK